MDELIRSAKKGKAISESDIPPPVAGAPAAAATAAPTAAASESVAAAEKPAPPAEKPPSPPEVSPKPNVAPRTGDVAATTTDAGTLHVLEGRREEYKRAALVAKRQGDNATALQHFKVIKVGERRTAGCVTVVLLHDYAMWVDR